MGSTGRGRVRIGESSIDRPWAVKEEETEQVYKVAVFLMSNQSKLLSAQYKCTAKVAEVQE